MEYSQSHYTEIKKEKGKSPIQTKLNFVPPGRMFSIIQKPRTNQFLLFSKLFMKWQHYSERTEITSLIWEQRQTPSLETTSNTLLPRTEISRRVPATSSTLLAFLHTKLFAEIKHLHSTKSKFIPAFRIMSHAVEKAITLFHGDKAAELFRQIGLYNNMNLKSEPSFKVFYSCCSYKERLM